MVPIDNKKVLVLGLGVSGVAASESLRRQGAEVLALDSADNPSLQQDAQRLRKHGICVQLGVKHAPTVPFDLMVVSPGVPSTNQIFAEISARKIPVIGEFELGDPAFALSQYCDHGHERKDHDH